MARQKNDWASDAAPSMPSPLESQERVPIGGGWVFTEWGIVHDLTAADVERLSIPPFGPGVS